LHLPAWSVPTKTDSYCHMYRDNLIAANRGCDIIFGGRLHSLQYFVTSNSKLFHISQYVQIFTVCICFLPTQELIESLRVLATDIDVVRKETQQLADSCNAADREATSMTFRLLEERFHTLQKDAHDLLTMLKV